MSGSSDGVSRALLFCGAASRSKRKSAMDDLAVAIGTKITSGSSKGLYVTTAAVTVPRSPGKLATGGDDLGFRRTRLQLSGDAA
jgi:hypothetical protein